MCRVWRVKTVYVSCVESEDNLYVVYRRVKTVCVLCVESKDSLCVVCGE